MPLPLTHKNTRIVEREFLNLLKFEVNIDLNDVQSLSSLLPSNSLASPTPKLSSPKKPLTNSILNNKFNQFSKPSLNKTLNELASPFNPLPLNNQKGNKNHDVEYDTNINEIKKSNNYHDFTSLRRSQRLANRKLFPPNTIATSHVCNRVQKRPRNCSTPPTTYTRNIKPRLI